MFTLYLIGGAITFLFMLAILFQGNGDNKEVKKVATTPRSNRNATIKAQGPEVISNRRYKF